MTTVKNTDKNVKMSHAEVHFEHLDRAIKLWFSTFSGKEKVYVNDELVSEGRSWRFKNIHRFTYQGTNYEVEVGVDGWRGLLSSIYKIELRADGQRIDQDEIDYMASMGAKGKDGKFSIAKFLWSLLPFFVVGGVIGFIVGFYF